MNFSVSTACAMLKNVYFGLDVIVTELRWLFGEDRTYFRQLNRLENRQRQMQRSISQLTVLADPERRTVENDLALLKQDMATLAAEREARHRTVLCRVRQLADNTSY